MIRRSIRCISLLFIGCGISYFTIDNTREIIDDTQNSILISNYHENKKEKVVKKNNKKRSDYIAVLEIPKINFKRGLYSIKDPRNILSKNIIFLDKSDMPDKKNSQVIILGHSGNTSNAYFKNLYKLKKGNLIKMNYKNKNYEYKITDIYEIIKSGRLALESNQDKKTLTLVTCKGTNKQLVIVSTLIK